MANGKASGSTLVEETRRPELEKKLATIGWGLFFAWLGIVLLTGVGSGAVLLGIGIIILAMQGVRTYFHLGLERFWVVCGIIFLVGGIWGLAEFNLPFIPLVLVLVGIMLVVNAIRKK
jgi:hypothetical protein